MSRRASVFARLNPGKRRVRFPDEVVFEDHIKESDGDAIMNMLRRASVEIDLDRINMSGMTALHQVRDISGHDKTILPSQRRSTSLLAIMAPASFPTFDKWAQFPEEN